MKILIIEDDENILSFLKRGFEEDGYIIDTATNGEDGEYLATVNTYDLIILDWMLPMKDGMEILSTLRNQKISTPTIMLTAKSEIDDKVSALNIGADDYLSKPFSFKELNARVQTAKKPYSNNINPDKKQNNQ
jgi:DNA-binding response OmpR family regulator